jgi:hypothetical protein
MNQFLWFKFLFDEEHGIFDCMHYDNLHMFFLGWIMRLLDSLDNAFQRYHKRTDKLQSPEDVRQLVESLLKRVPPMTDGVHRLSRFNVGWWVLDAWSGGDYESMLQQILFVFTTHDGLVEDEGIRKDLAMVVRLTYSFYRKLKMKRWWRKAERKELKDDLLAMFKVAAKVFCLQPDDGPEELSVEDLLRELADPENKQATKLGEDDDDDGEEEEDDFCADDDDDGEEEAAHLGADDDDDGEEKEEEGPSSYAAVAPLVSGNGLSVPKMHGLTQALVTLDELGSIDVADSADFERAHIPMKANAKSGTRNRTDATRLRRLERLVAREHRDGRTPRVVDTERAKRFEEELEALEAATVKEDDTGSEAETESESDGGGGGGAMKQKKTASWRSSGGLESVKEALSDYSDSAVLLKTLRPIVSRAGSCGSSLKLGRTQDRAAVVLRSGHHFESRENGVCLFVASFVTTSGGIESLRAAALQLEPHPSGDGPQGRHPVSGLRWLQRRPICDMIALDSSSIDFRVHVVPAFTFGDEAKAEDGYLLHHGIYNYDVRHAVVPPQRRASTSTGTS